ncbi:Riboflavin synthase, alpha subunit [Thermus sp. CCB_US3_UF1]|uniref:riboflavin synthase n=1 Tax=Thermus sp. CCB_US3_UF1 TaxID=1111069 RepID=UPI00023891E8|nr:riboflavin synthase [Thermus sp. CCB_US3_UF1]AEV16494.1 Riboflavin synthase, alpha subunit [Thermus sp. CCB_US3_UF1]
MFTGLVEETGEIVEVEEGPFLRVRIAAREVLSDLKVGDSVAVDGACLTAVAVDGEGFWVELSQETLARTAPTWRVGHRPNLERALKVGDRLGGHFVTGHVDGVADLLRVEEAPGARNYHFRPPKGYARYIAEKGSVALNGVSLTVAGLVGEGFFVTLIPHTLGVTNLGRLRPGDRVNLEVDLIARYLERLMRGE